jgi:hypothetical protein
VCMISLLSFLWSLSPLPRCISLLYDTHPGVRTIFALTVSPLSHSLSLLYDTHPSVRTIFVFTVSLLSFSLSLLLSCLYRLVAFVFLEIHIHIHSFIHTGCLSRGGLGA